MGVFGGGQNAAMTEDLLHLQQIDTGFDQMGGVAVSQAVQGDLFFIPQACTTSRMAVCTPPRSSGVVGRVLPLRPPLRLGKSSTGLRCSDQKRRSRS